MFRLLIFFLLSFFDRFISFQDIVEENANLVHKLWVEGKGYLYVCGKVHFWIWIFLDKHVYQSKPKSRIQNYCLCVHVQLGSPAHLLLLVGWRIWPHCLCQGLCLWPPVIVFVFVFVSVKVFVHELQSASVSAIDFPSTVTTRARCLEWW